MDTGDFMLLLGLAGVLDVGAIIKSAGRRKRADSYFPQEERVRLVRLVSHWELPGERSGESTIEYS